MESELVKMSPKGQLVVPQDIRKAEGFHPGDRFVSFPVKEGVVFKRVRLPEVKAEFEQLARQVSAKLRQRKVSRKVANEAVAWARRSS